MYGCFSFSENKFHFCIFIKNYARGIILQILLSSKVSIKYNRSIKRTIKSDIGNGGNRVVSPKLYDWLTYCFVFVCIYISPVHYFIFYCLHCDRFLVLGENKSLFFRIWTIRSIACVFDGINALKLKQELNINEIL